MLVDAIMVVGYWYWALTGTLQSPGIDKDEKVLVRY